MLCLFSIVPFFFVNLQKARRLYTPVSWNRYFYPLITNNSEAFVVPYWPNGTFALYHNTAYAGQLSTLTNYNHINTIYIPDKGHAEQLTLKLYDTNNNLILTIPPYIKEYHSSLEIFALNTNLNNIAKIQIFNQNNVDKTQDLVIDVFRNTK